MANWDLPNADPAATWGMSMTTVANRRSRLHLHRPRWHPQSPRARADPAYAAAVAAERRKAGAAAEPMAKGKAKAKG